MERSHGDRPARLGQSERSLWLLLAVALLVTVACVLWPASVVVYRMIGGPSPEADGVSFGGVGLLANTFFYAGFIAALATVLGWPAAWVLRRAGPVRIALIGAPLLGPSYLAYAGWGILRGEGSLLGNLIARADPAWHAPTIAWRVNAVLGLVLWAWPLAAIALCIAIRRIPDETLEMLRLDARTRRGACWERLAMARTGLAWGFGLVLLVMLGSAVPLQVAQVRTWAIHIWVMLMTTPDYRRVWAAAWPLLLVALFAAALIGRRIDRFDAAGVRPGAPRIGASPLHVAATVLLWIASVIAPAAIFLWSIKATRNPVTGQIIQTRLERFAYIAHGFLAESSDAIANSAINAALVAAIGALVGAGVWAAASARRPGLRRAGRWCTRLLLVAGLVPGILVGLAVHQAWDQPTFTRPIGDSPAIFVIAHLARFAFIGALAGWLLGRTEAGQQRDLRTLDGATGVAGWARVCLAQSWPVLAGAAIAMAALSLHEIEAAIWVQRPGEPFLARVMLDDLHYARDERLAVGVITVMIGGLLLGLASAWLFALSFRADPRGSRGRTPTGSMQRPPSGGVVK